MGRIFVSPDSIRCRVRGSDQLFAFGRALDRQSKSYRDLPSYSELKMNWRNLSLPFTQPSPEYIAINREAVCRGCLSHDSVLLSLRELPFAKNTVCNSWTERKVHGQASRKSARMGGSNRQFIATSCRSSQPSRTCHSCS